jgi:hypothetical protein
LLFATDFVFRTSAVFKPQGIKYSFVTVCVVEGDQGGGGVLLVSSFVSWFFLRYPSHKLLAAFIYYVV